jgi:hypothetical protein
MHATQNMERCQVGSDAAGSVAGECFCQRMAYKNQSLFREDFDYQFFSLDSIIIHHHHHHHMRNV